ncbi:hypothetical protein ACOMHN_033430 [Nucella lapillus]
MPSVPERVLPGRLPTRGNRVSRLQLQTKAMHYLNQCSAIFHDLVQLTFRLSVPLIKDINDNDDDDDEDDDVKASLFAGKWNVTAGVRLIMNMSPATTRDVLHTFHTTCKTVDASHHPLEQVVTHDDSDHDDEPANAKSLKQALAQMTPEEQQQLLHVLDALWQDVLDKADNSQVTSLPQQVHIADVCCMVG